jgi:hypothetical protein
MNRKERLEREQRHRKMNREQVLRNWIDSNRRQLVSFGRAVPAQSSMGEPSTSTPAVGTTAAPISVYIVLLLFALIDPRAIATASDTLLHQPFPSASRALAWPEFKSFVDNDVSLEQFRLNLAEKQDELNQSITAWRNTLESSISGMLPEDTREPDFNVPHFQLKITTVEHDKPIDGLAMDLKKLLRADVVFRGHHTRLHYYPDDFVCTDLNAEQVTYDAEAAKIAKALLNLLGRPDASYLELKTFGRAFQCGRCHSSAEYRTWKDIVRAAFAISTSGANTPGIGCALFS